MCHLCRLIKKDIVYSSGKGWWSTGESLSLTFWVRVSTYVTCIFGNSSCWISGQAKSNTSFSNTLHPPSLGNLTWPFFPDAKLQHGSKGMCSWPQLFKILTLRETQCLYWYCRTLICHPQSLGRRSEGCLGPLHGCQWSRMVLLKRSRCLQKSGFPCLCTFEVYTLP